MFLSLPAKAYVELLIIRLGKTCCTYMAEPLLMLTAKIFSTMFEESLSVVSTIPPVPLAMVSISVPAKPDFRARICAIHEKRGAGRNKHKPGNKF